MKAASRKGFTLIEILIVVIILGILAAIVIPQFSNASEDAKMSAVRSTVQSVRAQIELYKLQHNDCYPNGIDAATSTTTPAAATWNWNKLAMKTADSGTVDTAGRFGPYMQEIPTNPITRSATVAATAALGGGWVLDTDGRFWGVDRLGALVVQQ